DPFLVSHTWLKLDKSASPISNFPVRAQPISIPMRSVDVLGMPRIGLNLNTQARDQMVDTPGQWSMLVAPNLPQEFLSGDHHARTLTHIVQHFHFALSERCRLLPAHCGIVFEIKAELAKYQHVCRRMDTPKDRVNPRE